MSELKRAVDWLETGQYLVKHDESTYSVRETEFAPETNELRRALIDALRKEPCEICANFNRVDCKADNLEFTAVYCPNCGRMVKQDG